MSTLSFSIFFYDFQSAYSYVVPFFIIGFSNKLLTNFGLGIEADLAFFGDYMMTTDESPSFM